MPVLFDESLELLFKVVALHIGVHGLGDQLGMGDGLDDRARSGSSVIGGEKAGAGGAAVLVGDKLSAAGIQSMI